MSVRLQELLHKYEVGAGAAMVRFAFVILAVIVFRDAVVGSFNSASSCLQGSC